MAIPQKFRANTASIPAPLGGWNARDSLANMDAMDAVEMVNFFPTPSDVLLRQGYSKASTEITGKVYSLMNYTDQTDPNGYKLFAAAGTKIYNAKPDPAVEVFDGISDSKFQHVNMTNSGGHYLVACNGVDPTMIYDGTQWFFLATTETAQTISTITHVGAVATLTTAAAHNLVTGNRVTISGATESAYNGTYVITVLSSTQFTYTMATTPAADASVVGSYTVLGITGVDSSTFINVNLFKHRLYFTQKDTLKCWYLPLDSIAGAAQPLDFGGVARQAGYLQAMGTWTLDAGEGVDDYAVFVTSMGEIIVYNGTNPAETASWTLKGVWQLGQTFSRRCFFKWSGDLLLLTQDGLVPLASALQSSRLDPRVNLTDKIFYAVSQAATVYHSNFGWQIMYFASENMLILNIPTDTGMEQYVMHTITKSWARFTGIEAYCFEVSGDNDLHFGGDGFVGKFWDRNSDDGAIINATVQQAYNYFDSRGQQKRFTMVRPILLVSNGAPAVLCGVNTDFDTQNQLGQVTFNPSTLEIGIWDFSDWDDASWGGGLQVVKNWQGVTGIGYCGSISINVASKNTEVHWASTDFVMERGAVI